MKMKFTLTLIFLTLLGTLNGGNVSIKESEYYSDYLKYFEIKNPIGASMIDGKEEKTVLEGDKTYPCEGKACFRKIYEYKNQNNFFVEITGEYEKAYRTHRPGPGILTDHTLWVNEDNVITENNINTIIKGSFYVYAASKVKIYSDVQRVLISFFDCRKAFSKTLSSYTKKVDCYGETNDSIYNELSLELMNSVSEKFRLESMRDMEGRHFNMDTAKLDEEIEKIRLELGKEKEKETVASAEYDKIRSEKKELDKAISDLTANKELCTSEITLINYNLEEVIKKVNENLTIFYNLISCVQKLMRELEDVEKIIKEKKNEKAKIEEELQALNDVKTKKQAEMKKMSDDAAETLSKGESYKQKQQEYTNRKEVAENECVKIKDDLKSKIGAQIQTNLEYRQRTNEMNDILINIFIYERKIKALESAKTGPSGGRQAINVVNIDEKIEELERSIAKLKLRLKEFANQVDLYKCRPMDTKFNEYSNSFLTSYLTAAEKGKQLLKKTANNRVFKCIIQSFTNMMNPQNQDVEQMQYIVKSESDFISQYYNQFKVFFDNLPTNFEEAHKMMKKLLRRMNK